MRKVFILALVIPMILAAQDPASGKKQPPSHPLEVGQEAQGKSTQAPLPKIDLPEFVITGSASINPPDVQKKEYDDAGVYRRSPAENTAGTRDRQTIDLGERFKQSLLLTGQRLNGALTASLGTFFTPALWVSTGMAEETYDASATADYRRTKGFTRNADASSGGISLDGSIVALSESPLLNHARLGGTALFGIRKYKFYGSQSSSAGREQTVTGFHLTAHSGSESPSFLQAGIAFHSFRVTDTATAVTENHAAIQAGGEVPIFDFPVEVRLDGDFSTIASLAPEKTSLVRLTVGTGTLSAGNFFFRASANGYLVHGMRDQQGSYFFPHVLMGFRGWVSHRLTISYDPSVSFSSLRGELEENPYLSGQSTLRHPVIRLSASLGIESDWTGWLCTKVRFSYESGTDVPLYADSTGRGMWTLIYGGTSTIMTVRGDAVANITPNDYFAVAVTARNTKNSVINGSLPYSAGVEASVLYRHDFERGIALVPSVSLVGPRTSNVIAGPKVNSCFLGALRTEYSGIAGMTLFLDIENLFDQKYEIWRGYRAVPLTISLGLSYRW